jgi:hypothetical protein
MSAMSPTVVTVVIRKDAEKALFPASHHSLTSGQYQKKGENGLAALKESPRNIQCQPRHEGLRFRRMCRDILAASFLEPLKNARVDIINLHRLTRRI